MGERFLELVVVGELVLTDDCDVVVFRCTSISAFCLLCSKVVTSKQ
jgi:hypothetical protein